MTTIVCCMIGSFIGAFAAGTTGNVAETHTSGTGITSYQKHDSSARNAGR